MRLNLWRNLGQPARAVSQGCALTFILSLVSCSAKERVAPLSNTFIEDVDLKSTKDNLPFDHAWVKPGIKKDDFKTVYFKPIRIDLLPRDAWVKSSSVAVGTEEDFLAKAREIAKYFQAEIIDDMTKVKEPRLKLVQAPQNDSIVIEIVLTELELSHPVARAGALAVPIPGAGAALGTVTDPRVAFAARLTNGKDGKLIATVADRKFAPLRLIDLNKLTVSSSAREICALWAVTITEAIQSDGLTDISEKRFSLLPW